MHLLGMKKPATSKNVLLDSDDERPLKEERPIKEAKPIKDEPWKHSVVKYTILSKNQIEELEMEFIKRRMNFSKNNIKEVSKDLKIPFKRAYNYLHNKFKLTDNRILKKTTRGIRELEKINLRNEQVWRDYLEACRVIDGELCESQMTSSVIHNKSDPK